MAISNRSGTNIDLAKEFEELKISLLKEIRKVLASLGSLSVQGTRAVETIEKQAALQDEPIFIPEKIMGKDQEVDVREDSNSDSAFTEAEQALRKAKEKRNDREK